MMLFKSVSIVFAALLYLPTIGSAACSKEDIEFYLEKGFSQEQITQLCTTSDASVPDYKPYQQQVIIYSDEEAPGIKDGFTREEREAIKHLQLGADVKGLTIDQDYIKYISKICLAVQEGKEKDQRYKTCPDIDVVVDRVGLSVDASGRKFGLFGQEMIVIQGNIKRTLKGNSDDYFPAKYRQKLIQNFKWKTSKPVMSLPVRGDYSVTKLYDAVTTLSKVPDAGTTLAQNADENEDDIEPVENTEAKKNKRWWNPFD